MAWPSQLESLTKSISVADEQDGSFRVQYSTRRSGFYNILVYYSGKTTVSSVSGLAERVLVDSK